ncbi:MAG TPA: DUF1186 domain-containing protein [Acetobacteraceae bacterium]|nr:DUF1186 domain-containing protein [Acetobacteraceae bacterium]
MENILHRLADHGDHLPADAMRQALESWDAVSPVLLQRLSDYVEGRDRSEGAANIAFFTLFMAGERRDRRVFPLACRLALDPEAIESALGDGITDGFARILLSTFDGDRPRLLALIESRRADESARGAALEAYAWLAMTGALPREEFVAYLRDLPRRLEERGDDSFVWISWLNMILDLGLKDLSPLAEGAFARGRIDEVYMDVEEFRDEITRAPTTDAERLERLARNGAHPLEDAIAELSGWHGFSEEYRQSKASGLAAPEDWEPPPEPVRNPLRHVGRNDPCPCGSGKKYKKCCLAA